MAVLGKRKASVNDADDSRINDIFRRHFEAQFQPLPADTALDKAQRDSADEEDTVADEDAEEWGGLSDDSEGSEGSSMSLELFRIPQYSNA